MDDIKRKEAAASLLKDMESTAARMRELIVAMPPHDLLGYLYAQYVMEAIAGQSSASAQHEVNGPDDLINENQFLLEYVHAVLASDTPLANMTFTPRQCICCRLASTSASSPFGWAMRVRLLRIITLRRNHEGARIGQTSRTRCKNSTLPCA